MLIAESPLQVHPGTFQRWFALHDFLNLPDSTHRHSSC
jgi:hypothetical protein